ncbi:MAG: DUF3800 domain-containing protein [Kiritimatiellia bacterium]
MPKGERTLSVFADESGTFRHPDPSSRYYIVGLVLHDQVSDIWRLVDELDAATARMGLDPEVFASHAGPLIRKEKAFAPFRREWRAKVFKLLFDFARRADFRYHCLRVDKRYIDSPSGIVARLQTELAEFLLARRDDLRNFDRIKVYYDCGQSPVTNLLHRMFSEDIGCRVEFAQNVRPRNYKLFQVADLICTVSLIEQRLVNGERMTDSEYAFFGGPRMFRRNILKYLKRKEI